MALFELEQDFGSDPETEWKAPTFKDCAAADIDLTFFEQDEHADLHTVDGKEALVIVDDQRLKEHNSHWEAGAKQNFDTGLYTASTVLYIRVTTGRSRRSGSIWSWIRAPRSSGLTVS